MSLGLSGWCLINDFESDSFIFCWKLTHICEEKSKWASINKHILLRCSLPPPSAHCSLSSADTNSFYSNAAFLRLTSPGSRLPHGNINMGGDEPAFMCHFHSILSYFVIRSSVLNDLLHYWAANWSTGCDGEDVCVLMASSQTEPVHFIWSMSNVLLSFLSFLRRDPLYQVSMTSLATRRAP